MHAGLASARPNDRARRAARYAGRLPLGLGAVLLTWVLMLPVGVFGIGQIAATTWRQLNGPAEMVDIVAFYTGGRLLLDSPSRLYDPAAWIQLQTLLHAAIKPVLEFWNPPHTALLLAPLAMLPFGVAYLGVLLANLACLGGACFLLLPRPARLCHWLGWAAVLLLFLPVQLGLIMGQLSFALLLGFAVFVRLAQGGGGGTVRPAVALLAWTTKPQLLPVLVVSLACMRRWRTLALVCGLPVLLSVPVVLVGGWSVVLDYVQLARGAGTGVLSAEGSHLSSGHSLLGVAQWLLGPGWASNGLTLLGTLGVCGLVGSMWRAGLHTDARRHLQLALLPLTAVLSSPHALAYDAVTWLASAWLLLAFAREVRLPRGIVLSLLVAGWWGGNLAAFPEVNAIAPWGALSAIVSLAGIALLHYRFGHGRFAPHHPIALSPPEEPLERGTLSRENLLRQPRP